MDFFINHAVEFTMIALLGLLLYRDMKKKDNMQSISDGVSFLVSEKERENEANLLAEIVKSNKTMVEILGVMSQNIEINTRTHKEAQEWHRKAYNDAYRAEYQKEKKVP